MLRQELNQTKEDLAARNAEVEELKSRVAELEKLQQDQAALLQLKDSKLAAAEQRLAQSNAAAAPASTTQATPAQQQAAVPTWLWGGVALLVLGVFAWLFARRRAPAAERAASTTPKRSPRAFQSADGARRGRRSRRRAARRPAAGLHRNGPRPGPPPRGNALDLRARLARRRADVACGRRPARRRPRRTAKPPRSNSNSRAPTSTWATTTPRAWSCAKCSTAAIPPRATRRRGCCANCEGFRPTSQRGFVPRLRQQIL